MESSRQTLERLAGDRETLTRLARALVGDPDRAEDLVQDGFAGALALPAEPAAGWRTWLARFVRSRGGNLRRADARRRRREGEHARAATVESPEVAREREALRASLADALDAVAEPARGALVLRYDQELAPSEIAQRLGVPLETVRARLRRGRVALRAQLVRRGHGERLERLALLACFPQDCARAAPTPGLEALVLGGVAVAAVAVGALVQRVAGGSTPRDRDGAAFEVAELATLPTALATGDVGPPSRQDPTPASPVLGAAARHTGRVSFGGEPFDAPALPPETFANSCFVDAIEDATDRAVLVGPGGGLADVLVTVEVEGAALPDGPREPVTLTLRGGRFEPHAQLAPVGAHFLFANESTCSANLHGYARRNAAFNVVVSAGGTLRMPRSTHEPPAPEDTPFDTYRPSSLAPFEHVETIELKSDVATWMRAWVHVVDTPFAALTDADGNWSVPRLPAGTHAVRFRHPTLGTLAGAIAVDAQGRASGDLRVRLGPQEAR